MLASPEDGGKERDKQAVDRMSGNKIVEKMTDRGTIAAQRPWVAARIDSVALTGIDTGGERPALRTAAKPERGKDRRTIGPHASTPGLGLRDVGLSSRQASRLGGCPGQGRPHHLPLG